MLNKGFKYIETKTCPNGTKEIISESKHKVLQIHFNEGYIHDISIYIRDKKTNQNKSYYNDMTNHNIPNKYEAIVTQYILMHRLSDVINDRTI
jgi:hypothetical protein